jgi:hypothetical protein
MTAEDRVDSTTLDAVAAQLARASTAALEASHELLAHYADTGDGPTQRAVDTLIDHGADALRALADSFADTSNGLRAAAGRTTTQSVEADRSSVRSGRRRGPFA